MDPPPCLARVDFAPPKPNHNGRVLPKPNENLGSQEHSKQEINPKHNPRKWALPLLLFFFNALLELSLIDLINMTLIPPFTFLKIKVTFS
jgi:hypothetical protein